MNFAEIAVLATDICNKHVAPRSNSYVIPIISSNKNDKTLHKYILSLHEPKGIKSINIIRVNYRQLNILGRLHRYKDKVEIWIHDGLNTCWSRYVTAKELCHLIVDTKEESFTTDIERTINWMINDMKQGIDKALDSEHIAAMLAAEILVPYNKSVDLLKDTRKTSYEIASMFSVPERIIDALRSSDYSRDRNEAYKDINISLYASPSNNL